MTKCQLKPSTNAVVNQYIALLEPLIASGWNVVLQSKNKGQITIDSDFSICRFFEKQGVLHSVYIQLGVNADGGGTVLISESNITDPKSYYCKAKVKHINFDDFSEDYVRDIIDAYQDWINIEVTNTHGFTYLGFSSCDTVLFDTNQDDAPIMRVKISHDSN